MMYLLYSFYSRWKKTLTVSFLKAYRYFKSSDIEEKMCNGISFEYIKKDTETCYFHFSINQR